jgi:hypothetical protein
MSWPEIKIDASSGEILGKRVETGIVPLEVIRDLVAGKNTVFYSRGIYAAAVVESVTIKTRGMKDTSTGEDHETHFLMFLMKSAPKAEGETEEIVPSVSIDQHAGIMFRIMGTPIEYWIDGFDPETGKVILIKRAREAY